MINGVTQLVMTKADVLDSFENLAVCTDYKIDGKNTQQVPFQMSKLDIDPVYRHFKGWSRPVADCKSWNELPEEMNQYLNFINDYLGVSVNYVSNGPGRDQIIQSAL